MIDIYRDPIWEMMDVFNHPFFSDRRICDTGFKTSIHRPHNLVNVKDDNGKVIAQRLEVVTTPFAKDDVKVKVCDNMLSVTCGSENLVTKDNEEIMYRGISSQSYSFALSLTPSVDQKRITAENKDGILKINLPMIIEEPKKPEEIEIAIA